MMIAGGVIGGFSVTGVNATGSQYLTKASDLTGIADGKVGTVSVWIKSAAASDATSPLILSNGDSAANNRFYVSKFGDESARISALQSGGASAIVMGSRAKPFADHAWHHLLASWDTSDAASCLLYLDDADETNIISRTNANIDYTRGATAIHARYDGAFAFAGDVAELWFDAVNIDLSVEANRRKFIKADGTPTNLGSTGNKPTGSQPLLYMRGGAANWGTNKGSGGDFTVTGTFADASTKPSL